MGFTLNKTEEVAVGTSPTGSTFSTARIGEIVQTPVSAAATSSSIQNTDANDRVILDAGVYCEGVGNWFAQTGAGLATLSYWAATSSTNAPSTGIIGAPLAAMNVTVATATSKTYAATSTSYSNFARIWNTGSYLTFQPTGTSTTAVCTPFVHYIAT